MWNDSWSILSIIRIAQVPKILRDIILDIKKYLKSKSLQLTLKKLTDPDMPAESLV